MRVKSYQQELFEKPYPGRTLIAGMTPSGTHYVQVYWIMGRSVNSRNRIFEQDGLYVRNKAFDPALMEDPSLIIYYPIRHWGDAHIVSNGDQTDTIYEGLQLRQTFEQALMNREFEPDSPHFTPRISAVIYADVQQYELSILKTYDNDPSVCLRNRYHFSRFKLGTGHCIHTYEAERDGVLKPFKGDPFEVPLFDSIEETADFYWEGINPDNRISLLVKSISVEDQTIQYAFRNKHV